MLANKVRKLSGDIKRAKTTEDKVDILATQNAFLTALVVIINNSE